MSGQDLQSLKLRPTGCVAAIASLTIALVSNNNATAVPENGMSGRIAQPTALALLYRLTVWQPGEQHPG
jgi:hypothetical protein